MMNLVSLISFGLIFLKPFVFMVLWNWFPSVIFNLPELNYAQSFGLLLVIGFFKNQRINGKETEEKTKEHILTETFAVLMLFLFSWGIGFIVNAFM